MRFLPTVDPEWDELRPEERQALYRAIKSFVDAGGVVTLSEWQSLSAVERALLIEIRKGGPVAEIDILEGIADRIESRIKPPAVKVAAP